MVYNALAISDVLLALKSDDDIDSKGTNRLVVDIYDIFAKHGRQSMAFCKLKLYILPFRS